MVNSSSSASSAVGRLTRAVWRRLRWWLAGLALLTVVQIAIGYQVALYVNGNARAQLLDERAQRAATEDELVRLRSRLAIIERGTDVTGAANRKLRDELKMMEQALEASRSDIEFYRRLLSAGLEKGLGVHEMRLHPTASPRVFRFELTLALNSRQPGPARGTVTLAVHGIDDDRPQTLDLRELLPEDTQSLDYEFRYFQQLSGELVLPQGFTPERLSVVVKPRGKSDPVEREFDWNGLITS